MDIPQRMERRWKRPAKFIHKVRERTRHRTKNNFKYNKDRARQILEN